MAARFPRANRNGTSIDQSMPTPQCLPQMYNIGKIKVLNIYFPFGRDNDAKLLLAPSREGLVILRSRGCLARKLKCLLGALLWPPRGPAGLGACLSPIEMWVLLGPVARGPGLLFSLFVAELSPTEKSGIGRSPQWPFSEPI